MKVNLNKLTFSSQLIVLLILVLVYTFYFIDEELLVSLITTFVLVGAYRITALSINGLFMSNINSVFQKISIYILMNLSVLNLLVANFEKISLFVLYRSVYAQLLERAFWRLNKVESLFFKTVILLTYNIAAFFLSLNTGSYTLSSSSNRIKEDNSLKASALELFIISLNFKLQLRFVKVFARLLIK